MADLCRAVGARQASCAVWTGTDGTNNEWPWTLRESFGEVYLSREYARRGNLLETLPDDATPTQIHDALARWEQVRTVAEQQAWLRKTYPGEFCQECESPLFDNDDVCREMTCPLYGIPASER